MGKFVNSLERYYATYSPEEALTQADSEAQRLFVRYGLQEYSKHLKHNVTSNVDQTIATRVNSFLTSPSANKTLQNKIEEYSLYYERGAKSTDVNNMTVRRTVSRKENGHYVQMGAFYVAIFRDFLLSKEILSFDELQNTEAKEREIFSIGRLLPMTVQEGRFLNAPYDVDCGQIKFLGFSKEKHLDVMWILTLHQLRPGAYSIDLYKFIDTERKKSSIYQHYITKDYDRYYKGWFITAESQSFASVSRLIGEETSKSILLDLIEPTSGHLMFKLVKSPTEKPIGGFDISINNQYISTSYSKNLKDDVEKWYHTSNSEFVQKNIPGGKRFVRSTMNDNSDIGGSVDDKVEMGKELLASIEQSHDIPFTISAEDLEKPENYWLTREHQEDLIRRGADVSIIDEETGCTAIHLLVQTRRYGGLQLVLDRDDVDFTVTTSNGKYPHQMFRYIPSFDGPPTESEKYYGLVFDRTIEQLRAQGLTRDQAHSKATGISEEHIAELREYADGLDNTPKIEP